MNRTTFALFVALLIHLLLVLAIWIFFLVVPDVAKPTKEKEQKIKISLKEMPKKHKTTGMTKKKPKPSPIAPAMPKGKQLKKIVKSKNVHYKPKKPKVTPHLNNPKKAPAPSKTKKTYEHPKPVHTKPFIPLKPKVKKSYEKKQHSKMSWAYEDKSDEEKVKKQKKVSSASNISQNIKELYGDEFGKLTKGQQEYIINNQEIMRRITQRVLTRVAGVNLRRNMNVNRSNVIEFYLHPNGDMTNFKFLHKSGYFVLDDTTRETISYAYSRYPRPKEKILIRYNVFYNLARY